MLFFISNIDKWLFFIKTKNNQEFIGQAMNFQMTTDKDG